MDRIKRHEYAGRSYDRAYFVIFKMELSTDELKWLENKLIEKFRVNEKYGGYTNINKNSSK